MPNLAEIVRGVGALFSKEDSESAFWHKELRRYRRWFDGELPELYHTPSPRDDQKVAAANDQDASILTWHRLHQMPKYLADLRLSANAFDGRRVLDLGSGPMPSATCFRGASVYCLEPLLPQYLRAGFPLHCYEGVQWIHAHAERIPVVDGFFDAVISVNAIDHVDDIAATAREVRRVLRPGGRLRMHVHYHPPTRCEPVALDDTTFVELFGACGPLVKVHETDRNHSSELPRGERFVLWST